jgi:4-amino-4-deoxy-L-arabinose transferase-like glycosyltransferase
MAPYAFIRISGNRFEAVIFAMDIFALPIALFSLVLGYFLPGFLASFMFFRDRELSSMERCGLSLLLSVAIAGSLMTLLGMSIGFSALSTTALLLIFCGLAYALVREEINAHLRRILYSPALPRLSLGEGIIFFFVLVQLFFAFYYSAFFPIDGGDALTLHAPLAKIYADAGSLVPLEGVLSFYTPLSHGIHLFASWFYLLNGFNDLFARLIPPMLFLASCMLLYSLAHRLFGNANAWLALLIFSCTPLVMAHAQVFYLNLPEMAFVLGGLLCLFLGLRNDIKPAYFAAGFIGGFAALVKPSGIISFGLLALLLLFYFRKLNLMRALALLGLGALFSASPLWFAANSQAYLDPGYEFYAFAPSSAESATHFPFFPFFDAQIAVNQGIGPFLFSFGIVGAYLLYKQRTQRAFEKRFALASFILLFILSELFLFRLGARFALVLVPFASILAAYGVFSLAQSCQPHVRLLSAVLLAVLILPFAVLGPIGFKSARISYETSTLVFNFYIPPPSHEKFMLDSYGPDILAGVNYLNTQTPANAKAATNLPLTYLINRTIYLTTDKHISGPAEDFSSAIAYMQANGISYVFMANADVAKVDDTADVISSNLNSPHFEEVYNNSRVQIFRVV